MSRRAFEKTVDAARGRWKGILIALGMNPAHLDGEHHPCPACGGKDRFRFEDRDGSGSWYCSTCTPPAGYGMGLAMKLTHQPFPETAKRIDAIMGTVQVDDPKPTKPAQDHAAIMRSVAKGAKRVGPGDPVLTYLTRRCGDLDLSLLEDIRFQPALKHKPSSSVHPGMLAMMGWDGRKFAGIHRTFLAHDGSKAPVDPVRMMLGEAGAIRLGPAADEMGIAEGIETALCAAKIFGMPVWAATCANVLKAWKPPEGVRKAWIFGDNDESFTGQAAASELARALRSLGLEVEVRIPEVTGQDWADVWALAQKGKVA